MSNDFRHDRQAGLRSLDLTCVAMGPFATRILAGPGADVPARLSKTRPAVS